MRGLSAGGSDDFFSYTVEQRIRLRDWRLGVLDYSIKLLILLYILYSICSGKVLKPVTPEVGASVRPCLHDPTVRPSLCSAPCEDQLSPETCAALRYPPDSECREPALKLVRVQQEALKTCWKLVNELGAIELNENFILAKALNISCSDFTFGSTVRGLWTGNAIVEYTRLSGKTTNLTLVFQNTSKIQNPSLAEVQDNALAAAGFVADYVPGSVLFSLLSNMLNSEATVVLARSAKACYGGQVNDVSRGSSEKQLLLQTSLTHFYRLNSPADGLTMDRPPVANSPLVEVGTTHVQDLSDKSITVLFSMLGAQPLGVTASLATCPEHLGCVDVAGLSINNTVGRDDTLANAIQIPVAQLLARGMLDLRKCAGSTSCRIHIDLHLTNNVWPALLKFGLFGFAGAYGTVNAEMQIFNFTVPDLAQTSSTWLEQGAVEYIKHKHGFTVSLQVSSSLLVFSWTQSLIYFGSAIATLTVSTYIVSMVAKSSMFVGPRSHLYRTYMELESADMSYLEQDFPKDNNFKTKEEAIQALAEERRKQMLRVGNYHLAPGHAQPQIVDSRPPSLGQDAKSRETLEHAAKVTP